MLEGEWQANGVEPELFEAPHDGGEVLGHAVISLAQVPRRGKASIEAVPAPDMQRQS